ncbi:hypothetical protein CP500_013615 [Tychonema bourrellyi FEM_GT703]|uniref:Uncharacterized protein n=1 Tax=Tychonema bourrellyi FEM_GT703 TaxID=2040638 RepID=A0A2G4EZC7_9CYAN|nr:hypothetical protein CP500_013615 [Tychonema bourrellyi FEM_GT703]
MKQPWGEGGFIEIVCASQILSVKPAPTAPERNINPHFPKKKFERADARKRVKRKEGKEQKGKRAEKSPRGEN